MQDNLPVIDATSELNAAIILETGDFFLGKGVGHKGSVEGEICFNTSMTGYQEILTDPSYTGQIINFTTPHIGNVGTNSYDYESKTNGAKGLVLRSTISQPANFRSELAFNDWLIKYGIVGIADVDTRAITKIIRERGVCNAVISFVDEGDEINIATLLNKIRKLPPLLNVDLAVNVTSKRSHIYKRKSQQFGRFVNHNNEPEHHVIVVDFGVKENILNLLCEQNLKLEIVPATTKAEKIIERNPDGVFLSNGPGDPAATGNYAIAMIRKILEAKIPIFGICLGHQLLALASGLKTEKMFQGHRGANHPVFNLSEQTVEITSQNHGFCVMKDDCPEHVEITHLSLFDDTVEGIELKNTPAFSVQYHPESSPGPHDSKYLFAKFKNLIEQSKCQKEKI